jgi:hypothetical protein
MPRDIVSAYVFELLLLRPYYYVKGEKQCPFYFITPQSAFGGVVAAEHTTDDSFLNEVILTLSKIRHFDVVFVHTLHSITPSC